MSSFISISSSNNPYNLNISLLILNVGFRQLRMRRSIMGNGIVEVLSNLVRCQDFKLLLNNFCWKIIFFCFYFLSLLITQVSINIIYTFKKYNHRIIFLTRWLSQEGLLLYSYGESILLDNNAEWLINHFLYYSEKSWTKKLNWSFRINSAWLRQ